MQNLQKIRVSIGSAGVLGLKKIKTGRDTKTVFLMNSGKCEYNCSFCSQAKSSSSKESMLSRITWPEYDVNEVVDALEKNKQNYSRICMQVVNTKDFFEQIPLIVKKIREKNKKVKIAITIRTYKMQDIDLLFELGVNEIGIAIDAIDPVKFREIRGGNFDFHKKFILKSSKKYPGKIATHLIIGLDETEKQAVELMEELHKNKVILALFAFTPIRGSKFENLQAPNISSYRRIKVAEYLIKNNLNKNFKFNKKNQIMDFGIEKLQLFKILKNSNVFETSGCSDCNRPYYNERAGDKELFNYPFKLNQSQFKRVFETIFNY
ncbi:hypothetical protein A2272_01780 [Candidatus Peregrinibacteria bacterium RIFOXYA12_FULL_33_12]|nr:MAG: hypothetical protein A2272_01780 [Candidatus Peregrinibacteria bacterium RIFOXYA12_FULL_33_12]OGJ45488.1 MAG: hypothetical protein A2263_00240 [Candidatus Peregrinibacteria bacterium RIFOXYA2_FULL_33_21]OGJ51194.1 MAG: hypothetical protein A2307_05265 [Candidatus Peregrinibacteria bacterium RIFOXYB2_FULL_33_20]